MARPVRGSRAARLWRVVASPWAPSSSSRARRDSWRVAAWMGWTAGPSVPTASPTDSHASAAAASASACRSGRTSGPTTSSPSTRTTRAVPAPGTRACSAACQRRSAAGPVSARTSSRPPAPTGAEDSTAVSGKSIANHPGTAAGRGAPTRSIAPSPALSSRTDCRPCAAIAASATRRAAAGSAGRPAARASAAARVSAARSASSIRRLLQIPASETATKTSTASAAKSTRSWRASVTGRPPEGRSDRSATSSPGCRRRRGELDSDSI